MGKKRKIRAFCIQLLTKYTPFSIHLAISNSTGTMQIIMNRIALDSNILIYNHSLDYENIIYVSAEVVKETMHLIRQKKIAVKHWKTPNDIWKSITDHIIIAQAITNKIPVISSDTQFRHYKGQGLNLVFNNNHEKNKIAR